VWPVATVGAGHPCCMALLCLCSAAADGKKPHGFAEHPETAVSGVPWGCCPDLSRAVVGPVEMSHVRPCCARETQQRLLLNCSTQVQFLLFMCWQRAAMVRLQVL